MEEVIRVKFLLFGLIVRLSHTLLRLSFIISMFVVRNAEPQTLDCEKWLFAQAETSGTFILGAKPILETARLIIRPFDPQRDRKTDVTTILDTPDIQAEFADAGMGDSNAKALILKNLKRGIYLWTDPTFEIRRLDLVVEQRSLRKLIGIVHLTEYADSGNIELGYSVATPFRRQGYGREAMAGIIENVENATGLRVFYAWIRRDNTPSQELIGSLGFIKEADSADGRNEFFVRRHEILTKAARP